MEYGVRYTKNWNKYRVTQEKYFSLIKREMTTKEELVSLLCSKLLQKVKHVLSSNLHQIKIFFMLVPISRMVNLESDKLSEEPMQEIHQI